jgi:hypothetical protein
LNRERLWPLQEIAEDKDERESTVSGRENSGDGSASIVVLERGGGREGE